NGLKCHLLAGLVARRSVPVIWHIRDFLTARPVMGKLLRRFARAPAAAIANSKATAADASRVLPACRIEAIYNRIDTHFFCPGPADSAVLDRLADLPSAPSATPRIGLVATYARWKGQDVFLNAAAKVIREFPGTPPRFYIVGGPVYSTVGSQFSVEELRQ